MSKSKSQNSKPQVSMAARRLLSRRQFIKMAALGAGAMAAPGLLSACGAAPAANEPTAAAPTSAAPATAEATQAPQSATNLKMWWWGEQEAVGIQKWMDDTLTKFKEQTGATIEPTLMDTDQVIPQFTTAAAAGNVPDIQFFFNGIYHMENTWLGYIAPLNGLVSDDVLKNSGATALSVFDGKQYRVGFYSIGFGVQYNKELFDKAKLNADEPPSTWDAFLDACDKLKASGVTPFGGGVQDGFFGEWYLVNALTQNLDSPADALNLFIGNLDWREPKYHEHWVHLEELYKGGFINNDINSLQLYQGIQLYDTGKAAMCLNTTPAIPNSQQQLGVEKVGYMVMPVFGKGKMAGIPVLDTQGFGIPAKAADQANAAKFLEFIHSPDRVQAMWTLSKQIPANTTFDSSVVDDPLLKTVAEKWVSGTHNVYVADLMPTLFWTDAMFVASQKILAGELTGEASGDLAHDVTEKWKSQNPDMVENYTKWGKDLAA
ncbi:MAG: extracellular solute-binding protein [Chloroflexi bacterium]|nr:extracellular solute-binding protein [Chloroflexota bacterium]